MNIKANGKEYNIEYTFEAAESDIVQKAFDFFSGAYILKQGKEAKDPIGQLDAMMAGTAESSKFMIDFLYMGLLESHGLHEDGDKTIACREDAKRLYKQFCKENPEDERAFQFNMLMALREQMVEDGFFKRIGLESLMEMMNQEQPKIPQDHKKKAKA